MRKLALLLSLALLAAPLAPAAVAPVAPRCLKCHKKAQKAFAEAVVHAPVAQGDCFACHEDHGWAGKLVLKERAPKLCRGCHNSPSTAKVHSPYGSGECLSCHRVHSSAQAKLLVTNTAALCVRCHPETIAIQASVHAPVDKTDCVACHNGHQSAWEPLLSRSYPQERYQEFSETAYGLCFGCHDANAFREREARTGFRNSEFNLHAVHLLGKSERRYGIQKTRNRMTCGGCHLAHGSSQRKLIRPSYERRGVTIYWLRFTKLENGGGVCVVGCHKPMEYLSPLLSPEAAGSSDTIATPAGPAAVVKDRRSLN